MLSDTCLDESPFLDSETPPSYGSEKEYLKFCSETAILTLILSVVLGAESNLEKAIKQGTSDAQASSQLSSADSKTVIAAIENLIPDIEASLNAARSKKAKFAADGLTTTVQKDLATLKSESDDFASALIAIASADTKAQGTAQKAKIDSDFDAAIADFAS